MNENLLGQSRTFTDMKLTIVGFMDDWNTDWGTLAIVRADIINEETKEITATHTVRMTEGELADAGFTLYIQEERTMQELISTHTLSIPEVRKAINAVLPHVEGLTIPELQKIIATVLLQKLDRRHS